MENIRCRPDIGEAHAIINKHISGNQLWLYVYLRNLQIRGPGFIGDGTHKGMSAQVLSTYLARDVVTKPFRFY